MKRLFIALLMALSITTAFTQNITNAEYFFDADPGPGNGIVISVGTPAPAVNFTAAIPVNLSPGFHWLGIRTKDSDGKWGLFDRRDFYITQTTGDMPIITAAEYFFDHDPGVGMGTGLTIQNPGFAISQIFSIPVPAGMPGGTHQLAIRVKDQAGHWSLFQKDSIVVSNIATISCPGNITVTAPAGQCAAVVNNIDPTVAPAGSAFTYTLTGATTGTGSGTASGHVFNGGVTTVTYALSNSPNTNCSFTVTVNPNAAASVSIQASQTSICSGQMVTFTATVTNGGTDPTFEWTKNGSVVGSDTSVYQTTSLANGDVIRVTMQPYGSCAGNGAVYSNSITMIVGTGVTPSVTIAASAIDICAGTTVTFTANPVNGGSNPSYQWKLNGNNIPGATNSTYQSSTLANNDTVRVVMSSSMSCATSPTAVSNYISMDVSSSITPSVIITASQTNICPGTQVTFTATAANGGTTPSYQWKLNGNNIPGATNSTYQSSTLATGNVITVSMTSSLPCAGQTPVTSNSITMVVGGGVIPSVHIDATATTICPGTQVIFTAVPTNGGNTPTYQWWLNGNVIPGATSNTYQSSTLTNGNIVSVVMTTSLTCVTQTTASNGVYITVSQTVAPSAGLTPSATSICTGTLVTFTADEVNGGDHPSWQWKINGNNVGTDSIIFQSSTLQNGDVVSVVLTSSLACASPTTSTSNIVTMQVLQSLTFWRDLDGYGYGGYYSGTTQGCTPPTGYVDNNGDCNDSAATAHPGATEICGDSIDNNCNGLIDENCVVQIVPQLSIKAPHPVKEGDVGETKVYVELNLSAPSATTTAVHYSTSDDDATAGLDYLTTSGWLYFPAHSTHSILPLSILGDRLKESNERFYINFSQPVGITFSGDSSFRTMIIDDDKGKGNNAVAETGRIPSEDELMKISSVAKRNQVWTIPQIGKYQNEISILNVQGQVVKRFVNYQNHLALNNVSAGLYFYRIFMVDGKNQIRYYSGRLLITE